MLMRSKVWNGVTKKVLIRYNDFYLVWLLRLLLKIGVIIHQKNINVKKLGLWHRFFCVTWQSKWNPASFLYTLYLLPSFNKVIGLVWILILSFDWAFFIKVQLFYLSCYKLKFVLITELCSWDVLHGFQLPI